MTRTTPSDTPSQRTASPHTAPLQPPGQRAAEPAASPWPALAVVLVGAFMAVLDTFIVLVAAPAIQADLHASAADIQLIMAGYQLTYAIALITGARLGDRYGRRRLFLTGMGLFTLASVGCAIAPDPGSLIVARLAQGLTAAAMFPQVFAMIQVLVPAEKRPKAFGALGAVIGMATVVGQLLGGVLLSTGFATLSADLFGSSWRSVFWVNVPIGLATLALALLRVPESRAPEARRLDLPGALVLTVALFLLVVPLVEGRSYGWPLWTWLSLAGSALAFAAFALVERRVAASGGAPLVHLGLLRTRPFAVGITLVVIAYAGINSFFLILSLTLQDGLGMDALGAGLVYTPLAVAFFVASVSAGRLARFGRRVLQAGALVSGLGYATAIVLVGNAGTSLTAWALTPPLVLVGVGNGLLVTPLLNAVLAHVRPQEIGMASGVLSTCQQVGGAVGVAIIGVLYYGSLGNAAHHDTGAYGHALTSAVIFNLALAVAISALLPLLPSPPKAAAARSNAPAQNSNASPTSGT
ncbi:MFS transporter [Streptomyces chattanoogensis]|uniref:MFS transporter n=1 Tax=Streptomyces chattanoogensis TaxID=66876 RepID=UPI0006B4F187|nr:MFS transporter [Streptomyces chattanoogensis]